MLKNVTNQKTAQKIENTVECNRFVRENANIGIDFIKTIC